MVALLRLRQRVRSKLSTDFSLPQLRTKLGQLAFSHAGPAACNSMPEHIRAEPGALQMHRMTMMMIRLRTEASETSAAALCAK